MAAVSFVYAPTLTGLGTGGSFVVSLPSSILDGDGIFAFIYSDGAVSAAPSGWTLVGKQGASGAVGTMELSVWQKDEVTAADSDTTTDLWTRTDTNWLEKHIFHVRGATGSVVVAEIAFTHVNSASYEITPPSVTADKDGELWLVAAGNRAYSGSDLPTAFTDGATVITNMTNVLSQHALWGYVSEDTGGSSSGWSQIDFGSSTSTANALVAVIVRLQGLLSGSMSDGFVIGDDVLLPGQITDVLLDICGIDISMVSGHSYEDAVEEDFYLVPLVTVNRRYRDTVSDGPGLAEAFVVNMGKVVTERLGIAHPLIVNDRFGVSLQDLMGLAMALTISRPADVTEGLGLQQVLAATQATKVIERLGLTNVITPNLIYGLGLTQGIRISDILRRFFSGDVTDSLGLADGAPISVLVENALLIEALGVEAALNPQMVLRVIAKDEIEITPEQLTQMLYAGVIDDGIQISAMHVEPNGSITTWAINTRTTAVSEYSNYAFNSFAAIGKHKYLGASSDGLFELNGDDDDGTPIIARIKGGMMSFGGMHLSSIKGVYLGIRGAGDFLLKITTGDKKTYVYGMKARDFETTRVRPGKGLRARFFNFELISTGQDFDLEAIEFIPIVQDRRG